MKRSSLMASAAMAFVLFSSVSCHIDTMGNSDSKKKETMPDLTPAQMASMSSKEVADYYAKKNKMELEAFEEAEQETASSASSWFLQTNSVKKRERLGDMTQPLSNSRENTVFPWSDSDPNRSSTLLDRHSAVYDW